MSKMAKSGRKSRKQIRKYGLQSPEAITVYVQVQATGKDETVKTG